MKEFIPSNLKYGEVKNTPGIECIVILNHGNGSSITEAKYNFPLNEGGKEELERLLKILPLLKSEITRKPQEYMEYYGEKVAAKLNMNEEEVCQLIDASCRMDSKFEENCAIPDSYRIKFTDGTNILLYENSI